MAREDARDRVHIRTVDGPRRPTPQVLVKNESGAGEHIDNPPRHWWSPYVATDWPGVLCNTCDSRFRDGGYTSLLDFRFSRNPRCPSCLAQRTREATFGLPVSSAVYCSTPLWVDWRGCCVDNNVWSCAECGHQWG